MYQKSFSQTFRFDGSEDEYEQSKTQTKQIRKMESPDFYRKIKVKDLSNSYKRDV